MLAELLQSLDDEQEEKRKAIDAANSDESSTELKMMSSSVSEDSLTNSDFEDRKKEYALTYIMYMRFARRAEGVKASRSLFGRARRDKFASWEVYEAGGSCLLSPIPLMYSVLVCSADGISYYARQGSCDSNFRGRYGVAFKTERVCLTISHFSNLCE